MTQEQTDITTPTAAYQQTPEYQTRERIIERLRVKTRGREPTCPFCGTHTYAVGSFVTLPVTPLVGQMSLGRFSPCVQLVCQTCANVQFLHLLALGFTEEELAHLPNDV